MLKRREDSYLRRLQPRRPHPHLVATLSLALWPPAAATELKVQRQSSTCSLDTSLSMYLFIPSSNYPLDLHLEVLYDLTLTATTTKCLIRLVQEQWNSALIPVAKFRLGRPITQAKVRSPELQVRFNTPYHGQRWFHGGIGH